MLHPDGIEVFIKSLDRDQPYAEYVKPGNSEAASSKKKQRYIEIKTGEQFSIVFKIKKDFDRLSQLAVGAVVFVDKEVSNFSEHFNMSRRPNTEFLRNEDFTLEISHSQRDAGKGSCFKKQIIGKPVS